MGYLNQRHIPALPPSLQSTETMTSGRQFYFSVQICLYNIFLTPALPHGWALQSLHKGEGCLYEGGYNERSPDSRMSTLTIS